MLIIIQRRRHHQHLCLHMPTTVITAAKVPGLDTVVVVLTPIGEDDYHSLECCCRLIQGWRIQW